MKHILLSLLLLSNVTSFAQEKWKSALVIDFNDGKSVTVQLSDKPELTYDEKNLTVNVSSSTFSADYKQSEIKHLHFIENNPGNTEAIEESVASSMIIRVLDGNKVELIGVDSDCVLGVYSIDGRRVNAGLEKNANAIVIDLGAQTKGAYIVNMKNKQSFKVIVK